VAESKNSMMGLAFSPEQESLRESLRRFLERKWTRRELRAALDGSAAPDRDLWKALADELGLQGIAIPESYGGAGFGIMEQAVVLEEMGRSLLVSPYLSTSVVATQALLRGDSESLRSAWLPKFASGDAVATLAYLEGAADPLAQDIKVGARKDGDAWLVSGSKRFVVDGAHADLFIVPAKSSAGEDLLLAVPRDAPSVPRETPSVLRETQCVVTEALPVLDLTRPLATVRFIDAPGEVIASGARARRVLQETLAVACTAIACEQMGGAARALEITNEYAKTRQQFGAPIGSFQAIKFKLADMLLHLEAGRSAAYYAAASAAAEQEDALLSSSVAKAVCSDAYVAITGEAIQVHGGIAYTWEHDAHLYFKRARASLALFGDSDAHREQVAVLAEV